ncbi:hypothetical protein [Desulfogranum japonicum]|uniref:hypothetical protein n=1 Tax=Desulfogranum japonicum TaxID=231447 RepID=UPI00041AF727|nr:hypothetical protein [Desulfogranum japonicum]
MAEETKTGMVIVGQFNGVNEYTNKNTGQVIRQLLILVPGASSCLQVNPKAGVDPGQYKLMETVKMAVTPRSNYD